MMMPKTLNDETWYALPDGTPVYACANLDVDGRTSLGFALYTETEWDNDDRADYEVQADGRITFQGEATGWTADDLRAIATRSAPDA